ncbi:MAG: hypothetical protein IJQ26_02305 [Lachnospiraceae bacterium]|nr:hypothetical protein [Lachnospiraceae bacterium]
MEKGLRILFRTEGNDRIQIRSHVSLMSVLHNLVNNAVEAVEAEKKRVRSSSVNGLTGSGCWFP